MKKTLKTFDARTVERWRKWLAAHHASASEIWLVFHKAHTGRASVDYGDALDEALCFGWIDSLIRRIDETRYARKFTPRKAGSKWSASNRKRYTELEAAGRLRAAGKKRAPTDGADYGPLPIVPTELPPYIARGIKDHPAAWDYFQSLAPSHQRHYMMWIHMAKQQDTKDRRLREAIRLLSARQKLGLK